MLSDESTRLESALKQEQIAHDQLKKDYDSLQAKEKENEAFLIKEAIKTKKLNDELNSMKEKLKDSQEEYRKLNESYRSSMN